MVRSVPPSLVGRGWSSFWERYAGRNNMAYRWAGGACASIGLAAPKISDHSDAALSEERAVTLILYYVAFMIGGAFAAYLLGLLVEYEWGTHVSLIVFLAVYFF